MITRTMQLTLFLTFASFALAAGAAEVAEERIPDGLKVVSVEAWPKTVELPHRFAYRQVLITGQLETGEQVDLTRMAKLQGTPTAVEVSPTRLVSAKANGQESLTFTYGDKTVSVQVTVSGFDQEYQASFIRDIMPAMSKMGCNAGTCHGSKDGKNGFKLSLRGYDALHDHRALTDDVAARRFNRAAPDQSLMLLKASGSIPHVGGMPTQFGSAHYELLRSWIAAGVKFDADSPRVASIAVFPASPVLPRSGMKQQFAVLATYTDGSVRDVSREAFIESGDIEIASADNAGLTTVLRRGEAPVLVRYEGAYAAATMTVMGDRTGFAWNNPPTNNYVDELVYAKLQKVRSLPSELCSDEEFIRRVYLDLTGLPPTPEAVIEFLADKQDTKTKRDALVDRLVGSGEYVEHWTNKWADLLLVNRKFLGEEGAVALRNWIKEAVASNMPYDKFAHEILTASGSNLKNPAAGYWKTLRDADAAMENTTHLFLAVRFSCNKCHDHPFERWTQDQYYHMAAYFSQVGFKEDPTFKGKKIGGSAVEGAKPLVEIVFDKNNGEMTHLRTGQTAQPKFPYQGDLIDQQGSRRDQLAQWITAPENQYFAKSFVNRQWGYLFGRGIIEPIDDIRAGNPPTNGPLLEALTEEFVQSGFNIQQVHRTICKSRTYQHSSTTNQWNEDDTLNYSHAVARRLPAEVLYDAIHRAAGAQIRLPGVPAGFRAAQLPDVGVKVDFLDEFGRPVRETACECERSDTVLLGPIMKLINGPTVAEAVANPQNELAKLVAQEADDAKLIDQVFLRFLSRHASEAEIKNCQPFLHGTGEELAAAQAKLKAHQDTLPQRLAAWEKSVARGVTWTVLDPAEMKSQVGATFAKRDDQSIFVAGKTGKDTYTITAKTDVKGITGLRLEALPDDALAAKGPGRAKNGNFVVSEFKLIAAPAADSSKAAPVALKNPQADFNQQSWHVGGAIDGSLDTGWAVSPEFGKPHVALFETASDVGSDGPSLLTFEIVQHYPDGTHLLGRFRLSVTNSPRPLQAEGKLPENIVKILETPADQRSAEKKAALTAYYQTQDGELTRLTQQVQQLTAQQGNERLIGTQDLAWALINTPAFLFNR